MKVRIKGNSIRLRLTQTEVFNISFGEAVIERTDFPGGLSLAVSLSASSRQKNISCGFDGLEIRIVLPMMIAREWALTDQIGIDEILPNATLGGLKLLIEKDFACLDHREDDFDAFPNPAACGVHNS